MSGAYLIDNIVLIVLCGILLFIAFLYFTGFTPGLFIHLERLNPKFHHNKTTRVNSCVEKHRKSLNKFGLTRKCIWNHPCQKVFDYPLCDFWVCSSWKSYLPCNHKHDYASIEGIKYCLEMGARYIELDIFNKNMCSYTDPVVLNGSTPGRYQYTSGLDFEECCKAIYEYGMLSTPFRTSYRGKDAADPLFLCLNLHLEGNWYTLSKVASIIKKVLGPKLCSKRAEPSGLKGDKHLEYFRNKERE